ncbi:MAG: hypothetical protein ACYS8Z_21435 [Planctomycetota bacterium]
MDIIERRRKRILFSGIAVGIACVIVIVLIFVLLGGPREAEPVDYPPLDPGETLPHIGHNWQTGRSPSEFPFDANFPEMPTEMLVYRVVQPKDVTEADVKALMERLFDVPEDAELRYREDGNYYTYRDERYNFEYAASPGFFYMSKSKKPGTKFTESRKDCPSDEECKAIALKFFEERELLPEDAYIREITDDSESGGGICVTFGRMIGEYKVWGRGSEIIVRVGIGGEIITLSKEWHILEPYKMAPIISPEEALDDLRRPGAGYIAGGYKVEQITLRYDTHGVGESVQPVYYFEFDVEGYGVVAAVKPEHLLTRAETYQRERQRLKSH